MSNRIIRNLPDSKYKAVVGNTLAGGSNPFGTESEITDVIETTIEVNGLTSGIQGTSADVATQVMGSEWRMPKASELEALLHLSWYSVIINGINCFKVTAANGNYIYIPKSGYINNATQTYVGQRLCYLASEVFTSIINAAIALTTTSSGANTPISGVGVPWEEVGNRDTYAAIDYDATGTTFLIEYTM